MAHKAGYKVIQKNNHEQLSIELNQLGLDGWKPILLSTVLQPTPPIVGGANIIITVILEHENG
jgi:hypothetical protein